MSTLIRLRWTWRCKMGHYAAEMMCDKCGRVSCVCPPKPDTDQLLWVLDGFTPIQICDFDKKHAVHRLSPWVYRLDKIKYSTKAEAAAAIPALAAEHITQLKERIKKCKDDIKALKNLL